MITTNKSLAVSIEVHNATGVAKAKAGFFQRVAIMFSSDKAIKGRVESAVEEQIKLKLEQDLPKLVEQTIRKELLEQGIEADVKVI